MGLREDLVNKITSDDFAWIDVELAGGCQIQVCSPVAVEGRFLPVTASETWGLARDHGLYPLTRAVMDQIHNTAVRVHPSPQDDLIDFEWRSNYLAPRYGPYHGDSLVSGAHKLWVLSSRGRSINYGFHIDRKDTEPRRGGRYLEPQYTVLQSLGAVHNDAHWDYSQLLQLMRSVDPLVYGGQEYSLGMAIVAGLPPLWDEGARLNADDLPW